MSFLPAKPNFKLWIGTTWHYRFRWDEKLENGIVKPKDLTGYIGSMEIVPNGQTTPWKVLTNELHEGTGIIFNGASGLIDLIISEKDSESINWKSAAFIFKAKDPNSGESTPLLAGRLGAAGPL